jgi:uncharacterized protein YqgV (UPF0045/DUF77 family)
MEAIMFMNNIDSLFNSMQQIGTDLEEMRKEHNDSVLKAVNSHFEMQKKHCELAAQIFENQMEYCTAMFADLQETLGRNGVHRFISLVQVKQEKDKQEKTKKAA